MADCCSNETTTIFYSCSGAADVGQVADKATRRIARDGHGKMSCVAAIGAGLSGYIESAKGAALNVTIDGCENCCARLNLEKTGVVPKSFVLTDMGLKKGETEINDHLIRSIKQKIASELLTGP